MYAYFIAYEILFSIFNGPFSLRDLSNIMYKYSFIWHAFLTVVLLGADFICAIVVLTHISALPF